MIKHLKDFSRCNPKLIAQLDKKDHIFCYAYSRFLNKLVDKPCLKEPIFKNNRSVYHLGKPLLELRSMKIRIQGMDYTVAPRITFGGKAHHFATEKENAFKAVTKANFDSLPDASKVLISSARSIVG